MPKGVIRLSVDTQMNVEESIGTRVNENFFLMLVLLVAVISRRMLAESCELLMFCCYCEAPSVVFKRA